MDSNREIRPKARARIHEVILDWFASQPKGRVLDAPAGYGHLSMQLRNMGFTVVSGEIEPAIFKVASAPCTYTDLNTRIDAPDNSFDYVCCVDGLEHMTNPYVAMRELSRVLKEGGFGVFSVPNYSNMEKRLGYFLKGYLTKPKTIEDYREAGANLFNFHNSPLTITLLDLMFTINGLQIEQILRDRVKRKQYLLWPLVLLFKMIAMCSSQKARRKNRYDLTLRKEVVWGGNTMIFITRKAAVR